METDYRGRDVKEERPVARKPFRRPEIAYRGELHQITGYFGLFQATGGGIPGG